MKQVKRTFALLNTKNKKKLILLTMLQMVLGFLDLLAIVMVGIFSYCGSAYLGISTLPKNLTKFLTFFGLPVVDELGRTLVILIATSVILMVGKSVLALVVLKRTFRFLANRSAEISETIAMRFMHSSQQVINGISSQEATYSVARGLHVVEILGAFTVILAEVVVLVLLSGFILVSDPMLAILLLVYFVTLYMLSQKKLGSWARKNSKIFSESTIKGDQIFQDGIALYKELFIANKLSFVVDHFAKVRWKVADSNANIQLINYIPKMTFESALIIGTCLIGIQQIVMSTAESAIATLIMFLATGSRILPSLLRLQSATGVIQNASGGSDISFNLLKLIDDDKIRPGSRSEVQYSTSIFEPQIEICNLNFKYSDLNSFAVNNLSLSVPSGSSLAIVGQTGSGKSTLVDLILGILAPISGSIKVSGVDPFSAIQMWEGCIGYVPQVVAFVNGSVRENVAIGINPSDSNDEQIWKCLRLAQIESLFKESSEGLETLIGERGMRLSGGQRQRLGIARALYSRPKLLILDEATSALDAETEKAVAETIHNLSGKLTLIVIAHRIATVQELDQVIYLENGQIVAKGTFAEVRETLPQFQRQAKLLGL